MELSGGVQPEAAPVHGGYGGGYAGNWEQPARPSSFKPTPRPPPGPPPGLAAQGRPSWQPTGKQAWQSQQKPSKNSKPTVEAPSRPEGLLGWIHDLDENSSLVLEGLPAVGPVIHYDSSLQHLLSCANNILFDLVGDECGEIALNHDPEWTEYPQVGEAVKSLGFGEVSMCVAVCPSRSIWAVGLASKQKFRQQAARLSMCVALAANADTLGEVFSKHDGFHELCQTAGINTEDVIFTPAQQMAPKGGGRPNKRPKISQPEVDELIQDAEAEAYAEEEAMLAAELAAAEQSMLAEQAAAPDAAEVKEAWQPKTKEKKPYVPEIAMDRDTALWMRLDEDAPELVACSPEVLVLATDGSGRKDLYSHADDAVSRMLGDLLQEVEYLDDSDWTKFPAVGQALKKLGEKEECFTVALSQTRSLYGVGVGMKGRNRYAAAKIALAAQVALQQVEIGEDLPDISELQSFSDFMEEARAAKDHFLSM